METTPLIQDLNQSYDLGLHDMPTIGELETVLAERIDRMIREDFGTLVQLLYRIDVNESKLRQLLEENSGEDAGRLIARLILERQWQKIQTRRQYRQDAAGDEEKW